MFSSNVLCVNEHAEEQNKRKNNGKTKPNIRIIYEESENFLLSLFTVHCLTLCVLFKFCFRFPLLKLNFDDIYSAVVLLMSVSGYFFIGSLFCRFLFLHSLSAKRFFFQGNRMIILQIFYPILNYTTTKLDRNSVQNGFV